MIGQIWSELSEVSEQAIQLAQNVRTEPASHLLAKVLLDVAELRNRLSGLNELVTDPDREEIDLFDG
jgi:hypothetical protein